MHLGFPYALLAFSANIERTARGRATNPAKLSRTTPAELFSESSHGVVRERLLIASLFLSLASSLLSRRDSRCETIEGIEENSCVGWTGNREKPPVPKIAAETITHLSQ